MKLVDTRHVSIELDDDVAETYSIDPYLPPYSMHSTGFLKPDRVVIKWERTRLNETWQLTRLSVSGSRIKRNGDVGMNRATTEFVTYGRHIQPTELYPDWLGDLIIAWHP